MAMYRREFCLLVSVSITPNSVRVMKKCNVVVLTKKLSRELHFEDYSVPGNLGQVSNVAGIAGFGKNHNGPARILIHQTAAHYTW